MAQARRRGGIVDAEYQSSIDAIDGEESVSHEPIHKLLVTMFVDPEHGRHGLGRAPLNESAGTIIMNATGCHHSISAQLIGRKVRVRRRGERGRGAVRPF